VAAEESATLHTRPLSRPRNLMSMAIRATAAFCAVLLFLTMDSRRVDTISTELGKRRLLTFETAVGEQRLVALDAGATVTMNSGSKLRVWSETPWRPFKWLFKTTWHCQIVSGEALFSLKGRGHSDLQVVVNGLLVKDRGTVFAVRRVDQSHVRVTVEEGVTLLSAEHMIGTLVHARQVATFEFHDAYPLLSIAEYPADEIERQLAWQQGMVVSRAETLEWIARELARYSKTRIEVDPSLADALVGGAFKANEPLTFANAFVATHPNVRVEQDNSDPDHPVLRIRSTRGCRNNTGQQSQDPCHR
jgi:ferric-dicitrate binding protein FerR (iron transport regulator)